MDPNGWMTAAALGLAVGASVGLSVARDGRERRADAAATRRRLSTPGLHEAFAVVLPSLMLALVVVLVVVRGQLHIPALLLSLLCLGVGVAQHRRTRRAAREHTPAGR